MGLLKISGPVRRALGPNAVTLDAGVGLPTEAQCWKCGDGINFFTVRPGQISLSALHASAEVYVGVFGHGGHAESRVFVRDEFEQAVRAAGTHPDQMASPIAPSDMDQTLIVEGERIL